MQGVSRALRTVVRVGGLVRRKDLVNFLADSSCVSSQEATCYEGPITAAEVQDVLSEYGGNKSPGLDSLPYELDCSMPYLFGHLLACVYTNCQQSGKILKSVSRDVVKLLRKNPHKGNLIDNFRSITLLSAKLKVFG